MIFVEFIDLGTLAFLAFFGFWAAFIDAVVGGGGLVTIPALMWTGLPPVTVLGTNKTASVMGAVTSFYAFVKSGNVDTYLIKRLFPLSLIGSGLGVLTVREIPPDILRPLVVVMLIAVLIYSIAKRDWGRENHYHGLSRRMLYLSGVVAFTIGFYDGFFGPGTGSFFLFAFLLVGFDFIGAAGNARALNFASNIAAVILFNYFGYVNLSYALPMGVFMILGAYAGSHMALKKGTGYVRPLFIIMTSVLVGKQLIDLLTK